MSEKILKSRIVHKHDVAANWALATNFSPLKGEIIVYDPDENNAQPRVKVGDGETNVNDLPFVTDISKPTDLIVNMTAGFVTGKGVVYSCDTPFADMWAAYEDGGNVMFFIDGIHTSNVEFLIARADDAKSIHLAYINGSVYLEYTINEDNTVTWKADDLITRTTLQQETGTSTTKVMTQKAVTEALDLKADQTALDEVSALVGDTAVSDQIGAAIDAIPSEHFVVTVSSTTTDDKTTYTADKTFDEIEESYNNGCVLECNYKGVFYQLNSAYAGMSFIFVNSGTNGHNLITFFKNGTIRYVEVNYRNLITTLENNLTGQIAGKSDTSHTHDDRYYTESEIDTKLTEAKSYTDSEIAEWVGDKTVATQISNATANYYTKTQIDTYEFITVADIDEICGNVTEGGLPQSDIDELMTQLG